MGPRGNDTPCVYVRRHDDGGLFWWQPIDESETARERRWEGELALERRGARQTSAMFGTRASLPACCCCCRFEFKAGTLKQAEEETAAEHQLPRTHPASKLPHQRPIGYVALSSLSPDLLSQQTGNERRKGGPGLPQLLSSHSCTCFHSVLKQVRRAAPEDAPAVSSFLKTPLTAGDEHSGLQTEQHRHV